MVETANPRGLWPSIYQPIARAGTRLSEWLSPASEASSDDTSYQISVEIPGVAEDDVTLDVQDGVVSLKGEKREHTEKKGENWFFSERSYGAFSRSFRLPADADGDRAKATLKDGVLTIEVPRLPADAGRKTVKISKH